MIIIIIETKLHRIILTDRNYFSPAGFFRKRSSPQDFPRARIYAETFNISNTCLPESHVFTQFPRNAPLITSRSEKISFCPGQLPQRYCRRQIDGSLRDRRRLKYVRIIEY